ncbi:hypothetical protein ACET98_23390, partial [Aeromonas veronii]
MVHMKDKTRDLILEIWDCDYYIVAAGDQAPKKSEVITLGEKGNASNQLKWCLSIKAPITFSWSSM